jgi:hypothetical protein
MFDWFFEQKRGALMKFFADSFSSFAKMPLPLGFDRFVQNSQFKHPVF